jgi:hypothetical protein
MRTSCSAPLMFLPGMEDDQVGTEFLYIDSSSARPVQWSHRELSYADCPISRASPSALRVRFPGLRRSIEHLSLATLRLV